MVRGHDVVLLLLLAGEPREWTMRALASRTGLPLASVQRALHRLGDAGLYDSQRRRVRIGNAEEFLIHAVRYVVPASLGGTTRGVPTAWAAAPLADRLAPTDDLPPVWPHPEGATRGLALEPLYEAAPEASRLDPQLAERLALVDALRVGDARVRGLAADLLRERLRGRSSG